MLQELARQKQEQKQPNNILKVTKGMFHDYLDKNAMQESNSPLK